MLLAWRRVFFLGIFPRLGSGYPDLPVLKMPLKSIFKEVTQRNLITAAWANVAWAVFFCTFAKFSDQKGF